MGLQHPTASSFHDPLTLETGLTAECTETSMRDSPHRAHFGNSVPLRERHGFGEPTEDLTDSDCFDGLNVRGDIVGEPLSHRQGSLLKHTSQTPHSSVDQQSLAEYSHFPGIVCRHIWRISTNL